MRLNYSVGQKTDNPKPASLGSPLGERWLHRAAIEGTGEGLDGDTLKTHNYPDQETTKRRIVKP